MKSSVQAAKMGFWQKISDVALLNKVKKQIFTNLQHEIAASLTRKIATVLVQTCDTNIPGKNNKKQMCTVPGGQMPASCLKTRWQDYAVDFS